MGELQRSASHHPLCPHLLPALHGRTGHPPQPGNVGDSKYDLYEFNTVPHLRRSLCLVQGCLAPIKVVIPPGSILQPSLNAAVVGGNVLTSQRVVDVIFRAFEVCAASQVRNCTCHPELRFLFKICHLLIYRHFVPPQGCMNNISFGSEKRGYYETVAGGAGAGPGWNGRSGVHSHMTNTRITDPEILEKR